ncbi:thiamine pyrophosphate-binding protein [Alphaproteobacteria bacterium]|nr:thiamine pyrophosphate-binding protein [Alphaproteobacteria bacterium]
MQEAGSLLVQILENQKVDRVFCVPGESYLSVMNGLQETSIETILCKHEGAASMMAEADGKLTGRPGIAFVTRGPGATNAASGIHIAQQDSTPMILFVGQIGKEMYGRDAFQEVDYQQFFGGMAKLVIEVQQADRLPEIVSRAYHTAMSGRPGPVIIALPENMLTEKTNQNAPGFIDHISSAPTTKNLAQFIEEIKEAKKPMLILGGSVWSQEAEEDLASISEMLGLTIVTSHRRQSFFNNFHKNYGGDLGLDVNPKLINRVNESDYLILLGGRLSENPSQGFTLLNIPEHNKKFVHIHPGPEEIGRIYKPHLGIVSSPIDFVSSLNNALNGLNTKPQDVKQIETNLAHEEYIEWGDMSLEAPNSGVDLTAAFRELRDKIEKDTIITNGAGNYAVWGHRLFRFSKLNTQLAPISGSMGYGLPAAISAKLRYPDQMVIALAGDGCFQMTENEFATAVQYKAAVIVLVIDNEMYGTIRMHQHKHYKGNYKHTGLVNPDFCQLGNAMGGKGYTVENTGNFYSVFEKANKWAKQNNLPVLLHIKTGSEMVLPGKRFSAL